jgi:flavin-dependent dehydrogenase
MTSPASKVVRIAGAGPAGLSAAITLARAGLPVEVHERGPRPGCRHHFDYQAIENWSSEEDALEQLDRLGLDLDVRFYPIRELHLMRGKGPIVRTSTERPLAYMVQRGPGPGTLDDALACRARELDIPIHVHSKLARDQANIWATGPSGATGIVAGYTFETNHETLALCLLDEQLAPGGYVYLLVAGRKGTLATVLLHSFERARACLDQARGLLDGRFELDMKRVRAFGGVGQFRAPSSSSDGLSCPGEAGGFQDLLFGFGIRLALTTGHLSARSLIEGEELEPSRQEIQGILRASMSNRLLFELGGSLAHRYLILQAARRGPRTFLADWYRFGTGKAALYPLARVWLRSALAGRRPPRNIP